MGVVILITIALFGYIVRGVREAARVRSRKLRWMVISRSVVMFLFFEFVVFSAYYKMAAPLLIAALVMGFVAYIGLTVTIVRLHRTEKIV